MKYARDDAFYRSPKDDPQRHRVYRMERGFMEVHQRWGGRISYARAVEMAARASERWGLRPPRIVFQRKADGWSGYTDYMPPVIRLLPWDDSCGGQNPAVLLHELAHHIDNHRFDPCAESHGPTFCAIEMDLLDHFKLLPKRAFMLLARECGVRVRRNLRRVR